MTTEIQGKQHKTILYTETSGGLGNQLFQIFALHAFAHEKKFEPRVLECDSSPSVLQNRSVYWTVLFPTVQKVSRPRAIHYVHNDGDALEGFFEILVPSKSKNAEFWVQLKGYYQHRNHFWKRKEELIAQLLPPKLVWSTWNPLSIFVERYKSQLGNLAFVHIRRGDYKRLQHCHLVLPMQYYENALQCFPTTTKFLIFCEQEDIESVGKDFSTSKLFHNRIIFDSELIGSCPDYQQLFLMSICEAGGMIANSTFSVWAAYLHNSKTGVFTYPNQFFSHVPNKLPQIFDPTWKCVSIHASASQTTRTRWLDYVAKLKIAKGKEKGKEKEKEKEKEREEKR